MPQHLTTWAVAVLMASSALAAPTPAKPIQKRTVTVSVQARANLVRSPAEAMRHTFAKYNLDLSLLPNLDLSSQSKWIAPNFTSSWDDFGSDFPSGFGDDDGFGSGFGSGSGAGSPYPAGSGSPAPMGSNPPYPTGSGSPSPAGSGTPSPAGSGSPSPAGSGTPSPAGSGSPSPAGSGSPYPAGSSSPPSPAGSGSPGGASGSGSGTTNAEPADSDAMYLSNVKIGSNGQEIALDFDTGSSDLWIMSTKTSNAGSGHTLFDPSKSSSWKEYQGGSWKISYGDGSTASGTVGFDKVDIGGVVSDHQAIELADQVSQSFASNAKNNGLVGLGFGNINTVKPEQQKTFFENVQSHLSAPVFSCDLKHAQSGSYTFGAVDKSHGEIHYVPIDSSKGWWQFSVSKYSINGQESQCQGCNPAIADTGTSLMLVDQQIADAYYKQVQGAQNDQSQGGYVYDCNAKLPDLAVSIGDYMAVIPGSAITYAQQGDKCFGGVQGNKGQDVQIWGDVFLKPFLAVFDGGNKQFGVAPKK